MSWFVSDEPIAVELEGCRCPGGPHDHDTVWLRPELDPESGIAAVLAFNGDNETLTERLGRLYVERGVVAWTFVDEAGKPIPVSRALTSRLAWDAVWPIANRAAELYSEGLTRPLVLSASKSSSNGHTVPSTSAKRRSSSALPKR